MNKIFAIAAALAPLAVLVPKSVEAQEPTTDIIYACYVPGSGTMYRVRFDGGKAECTGNSHVAFSFNAKGIPGAAGAVGQQGPAGSEGPQGPQGPQGLAGTNGAVGPTGPEGLKGSTGENGTPGATGPTGGVGPQGPAGPNGPTGPTGPAGANGADGKIGPMGAQGPQGPAGSQGPQGPQGTAGAGVSSWNVTKSARFHCNQRSFCQISWACPAGQRPLSWFFEIENFKLFITDAPVVGANPTTANDGFTVTMENRSFLENTEWHIGLVCAATT